MASCFHNGFFQSQRGCGTKPKVGPLPALRAYLGINVQEDFQPQRGCGCITNTATTSLRLNEFPNPTQGSPAKGQPWALLHNLFEVKIGLGSLFCFVFTELQIASWTAFVPPRM